MNLKVNWELTDTDIREWFNTPEAIQVRNGLILSILEDECKDDHDDTRLNKLKEIWLIK